MKRTTICLALLALTFSAVGQGQQQTGQSQNKQQPSWSSEHRGLIRLSVELGKAIERDDVTKHDAEGLFARTMGVPDTTIMFMARRYHKDRDFAALADALTAEKNAMPSQAGVTRQPSDPVTCGIKAHGFYAGCFFNSPASNNPASNCSRGADQYYIDCVGGIIGPWDQQR